MTATSDELTKHLRNLAQCDGKLEFKDGPKGLRCTVSIPPAPMVPSGYVFTGILPDDEDLIIPGITLFLSKIMEYREANPVVTEPQHVSFPPEEV